MRFLVVTSLLLVLSVALFIGGLHTQPMWRLQGHLVSQDSVGNAGISSDTPLVYVHDHLVELWVAAICAALALAVAVVALMGGRDAE